MLPDEILKNLPAKVDRKKKDVKNVSNPVVAKRKRDLFLKVLADTGNVEEASAFIGYANTSYLKTLRRKDPDFAEAWHEALQAFADKIEGVVLHHAYNGQIKAKWHQGRVAGYEREYDTTLRLATLKALKPEVWGEKKTVDINHTKNVGVMVISVKERSLEEIEAASVAVHDRQRQLVAPVETNIIDVESTPVSEEPVEKDVTVEDLF